MIIKASVAKVREVTNPQADTLLFCTATKRIYFWDAASTGTDDGALIIKPTNMTTGRWLTTEATDPNA